jgi:hypothetical protein
LISNRLSRLVHQFLDVFDAAHLGVDFFEHFGPLLQAEQHVLLDERKLDVGGQALELLQLRVGLCEHRLLELFAPQGEQRALLVAPGEELLGRGGLEVG